MGFDSIEDLKKEANAQFDWMASRPTLFGFSPEESALSIDIARKTFEAALALDVGQLLQFKDIIGPAADKDQVRRVIQALPYLMGSLSLLELEFNHVVAGVLPREIAARVVRENPAEIHYMGQTLTTANVTLSYRRTDFKRK